MMELTIVVPCYNEEDCVLQFYKEVKKVALKIDGAIDLLFVDDGSSDCTLKEIKQLAKEDKRVNFLSLSRNFGKEAAMLAGLEHANGDYVVVMDADLQHPPELLPEMLHAVREEGYDSAAAKQIARNGKGRAYRVFAKFFYKLLNKLTNVKQEDGACDYRLMNRKFLAAVLQMKESNRYTKGLFAWVGFNTKWIPFEVPKRIAGKTKWSFGGLCFYAMEALISFSTVPLSIASFIGVLLAIAAIVWMVVIVLRTCLFGEPVTGYPTLICTMLLVGGFQLVCTGILGKYLAKTYVETKKRPVYLLKDSSFPEE